MKDRTSPAVAAVDPTTRPFWDAARLHRLRIQRCDSCGHYQFYPRPFCLKCDGENVKWVDSNGDAVVYSMTTVQMQISEDFKPPYVVGIVELQEGPRLLTNIVNGVCRIGDRVRLTWRDRVEGPPLPVFEPVSHDVKD